MASDVDAIFGVSSCLPVVSSRAHGLVFFAAENFVVRHSLGDGARAHFRGHAGEVQALAVEETSGCLFSADSTCLICWDLASMKQLARVSVGERHGEEDWRVRQMHCPKGGKLLVSLEHAVKSVRSNPIYAVRLRDPWHSFRILSEYSTTSHKVEASPVLPAILAVEGMLDFFLLTSHDLVALSWQSVKKRMHATPLVQDSEDRLFDLSYTWRIGTSAEELFIDGSVDESSASISVLSRHNLIWVVDMFTGTKIREVQLDARRGLFSSICCLPGERVLVGGSQGVVLALDKKKGSVMQDWAQVCKDKYIKSESMDTVLGDVPRDSTPLHPLISKMIRVSNALLVITDDGDLIVFDTQRRQQIASQTSFPGEISSLSLYGRSRYLSFALLVRTSLKM
ncbi:hypothetical protein GUITHDRAFT_101802 [Guillardia theta CCMP2712]|uniref:Uncharacterized protein n=1 Tax=Guillardia theta (strain CCMP2712) TaxID=905079 RepID=L1JVN2_GUITC|nr:hypothetical protein GUITHDRAFT_101802 [Guillardia theta CCMP2712]EKX52641.1 hypothetical protein GUITHDRAFT_101802 [Guillardia theta CCMP2712]|eukprot:XP_005839621.1 hypothetical protein GUITHDRAFT_101802 [Guillardia theta CCMP2712]